MRCADARPLRAPGERLAPVRLGNPTMRAREQANAETTLMQLIVFFFFLPVVACKLAKSLGWWRRGKVSSEAREVSSAPRGHCVLGSMIGASAAARLCSKFMVKIAKASKIHGANVGENFNESLSLSLALPSYVEREKDSGHSSK